MDLPRDLHNLLAFSVAVRQRDEVAVRQLATRVATQVTAETEIQAAERGIEVRGVDGKAREEERLLVAMRDRVGGLRVLVDCEGLSWLRTVASGDA